MAFVQHLWCFHRLDGGETIGPHQWYCVLMLPGSRTHNQPRTGCFSSGTTHQTLSRSCGVLLRLSSLVLYHHPVCITCSTPCWIVVFLACCYCTTIVQMLCTSQTRSLNLSTNPVQLSSHNDVAKSSSVADTSGTAVLNTQILRQVVRMSRDVAVHVNVSFTRNGSAEKQLSLKIPEVTQVLGRWRCQYKTCGRVARHPRTQQFQ